MGKLERKMGHDCYLYCTVFNVKCGLIGTNNIFIKISSLNWAVFNNGDLCWDKTHYNTWG